MVGQEDEGIPASFHSSSHDLLAFCPYPYPLRFLIGTAT